MHRVPITALEAFGKVLTVEQVVEKTPEVLLLDGPKAGWVYDVRRIQRIRQYKHKVEWSEPAEYQYTGQLYQLEDGRIVRGYEYVG